MPQTKTIWSNNEVESMGVVSLISKNVSDADTGAMVLEKFKVVS